MSTSVGSNGTRGRLIPRAGLQSLIIIVAGALIGLAINQFRPGGLPIPGDWSTAAQLQSPRTGKSMAVSLDEAILLFCNHQAAFLDARSEDGYRDGHIEGAINLPWLEFENRHEAIMAQISPDQPIITYCDGEACGLSKELALALKAKGYTDVRVLSNGWSLWVEARLPVESS